MKNRLVLSESNNPWKNLALEKFLFRSCVDENIFYLWQNTNTVVIGRNQNAWKECDLQRMKAENVFLARRESGGGAVFHDLGNLNFTFISPKSIHNVQKQMRNIQDAVAKFGIETDLNGRNDLTVRVNGCKFSGNAFQISSSCALHHGTILISVDTEKMRRYLTPSQKKLESKGVSSVQSRVSNLNVFEPSINVDKMRQALIAAFEKTYGTLDLEKPTLDSAKIEEYEKTLSSWEWCVGKTPEFNISLNNRFTWGELDILLSVQHGHIANAHIFSDALDGELIINIAHSLNGCQFSTEKISERLLSFNTVEAKELAQWVQQLEL